MTRDQDRVDRIQAQWRLERPDVDVTPQGTIGRIHRLSEALHARIDAVHAANGLTRGEFDVLAALRRAGDPFALAAGKLAEHTMITSGGLTKRVDRLVERGLVSRDTSATDGRGRSIALTSAGQALIDTAFEAHMANEHALIASLGEDRCALETTLAMWLAALGED